MAYVNSHGSYKPIPGLEKLTNANGSVSSVNDRLFPIELTEIADWKSMSDICYIRISEKP